MQGGTKDGVYEWPKLTSTTTPLLTFSTTKAPYSHWHARLGHLSSKILHHLISCRRLDMSTSSGSNFSCDSCHCNKIHKLPFSDSSLTSFAPLELVFSDVWSSPIHSYDGFINYVIIVDHFTRYIWLYPLQRKSDVSEVFIRFKSIVEKIFKQSIVTLYTDNDSEYML